MVADLGFIDDTGEILNNRFFLSKVGGKATWLNLKDLPTTEELMCANCNAPLRFLCQLYCPLDDKENAFHRTLFIFLCSTKECFRPNYNNNFTVFRCQLPRNNPYYPDTPPDVSFNDKNLCNDKKWTLDLGPSKFGVQVCSLCGNRALNKKENCLLWFCCEDHECQYDNDESVNLHLLPEYGLRIEPEYESDKESRSDGSDFEGEEDDYDKNIDFSKFGTAQDDPSVEQIFSECSENAMDKTFATFKLKIEDNPDQVIRYGREIQPLWLSQEHVPTGKDIPPCEYCSSERRFEFQVLPQLLNYISFNKEIDFSAGVFDWATLVVYTCKQSCDVGPAYKKEFLWKQDVLS